MSSKISGVRLASSHAPSAPIWTGHLDAAPDAPHAPVKGNAWLCLQSITLSGAKHPPHGPPFDVGDTLEIYLEKTIEPCVIANHVDRIVLMSRARDLAEPSPLQAGA